MLWMTWLMTAQAIDALPAETVLASETADYLSENTIGRLYAKVGTTLSPAAMEPIYAEAGENVMWEVFGVVSQDELTSTMGQTLAEWAVIAQFDPRAVIIDMIASDLGCGFDCYDDAALILDQSMLVKEGVAQSNTNLADWVLDSASPLTAASVAARTALIEQIIWSGIDGADGFFDIDDLVSRIVNGLDMVPQDMSLDLSEHMNEDMNGASPCAADTTGLTHSAFGTCGFPVTDDSAAGGDFGGPGSPVGYGGTTLNAGPGGNWRLSTECLQGNPLDYLKKQPSASEPDKGGTDPELLGGAIVKDETPPPAEGEPKPATATKDPATTPAAVSIMQVAQKLKDALKKHAAKTDIEQAEHRVNNTTAPADAEKVDVLDALGGLGAVVKFAGEHFSAGTSITIRDIDTHNGRNQPATSSEGIYGSIGGALSPDPTAEGDGAGPDCAWEALVGVMGCMFPNNEADFDLGLVCAPIDCAEAECQTDMVCACGETGASDEVETTCVHGPAQLATPSEFASCVSVDDSQAGANTSLVQGVCPDHCMVARTAEVAFADGNFSMTPSASDECATCTYAGAPDDQNDSLEAMCGGLPPEMWVAKCGAFDPPKE
jgi:hypothetical protein